MSESAARFTALDIFRGMTVCFMIIVNSPGDWSIAYAPLLHANWHGFTPTDLVFPSFLFAVGNAMAFSMLKFESQPSAIFWKKTLKRSALIFLLGFLMYWYPFYDFSAGEWKPLDSLRIPGVLQRIALCFLFASIIIYYGGRKFAVVFSVFALLAYWLLAFAFGEGNDPYALATNAGLRLDLFLLGPKHLYNGEGIPFDPEGLLSTLPAIVNVLIGYLAGDFIRRGGMSYEVLAKLMIAGAVLLFGAYCWDMYFPINKKLWTSSFVLMTCGLDLLILPVIIYVVNMLRITRWSYFFEVFGRNPLFIYLLSEVLMITAGLVIINEKNIQENLFLSFSSFMSPKNASLAFALLIMFTCWLTGWLLDKKKIYIRV